MEPLLVPRGPRRYCLAPWVIRVLIPPTTIGTYTLYARDGTVVYVGRSDTCLRRRLITHAVLHRASSFDYQVRWTAERAFIAECAAFHAFVGQVTNAIHPASPVGRALRCPFCRPNFDLVRSRRIEARSHADMVGIHVYMGEEPLLAEKKVHLAPFIEAEGACELA